MSAWSASGVLVVGHRGGRGEGWPPENTLEAFEQARLQGARAVELDVRTCAGGEVVVFHDETLERMTQGRHAGRVDRRSWPELRAIDLGGARVPSLADVLAWARERGVAVNVELKHDVSDRWALAREAARVARRSRVDVLYSSFDPLLLAMVSARDPRAPRAMLFHLGQQPWADILQEVARPPVVGALHLERTQLVAGAARRYAGRGLRVGVWTVNEASEATKLVESGAESIITDRPGVILSALGAA